MAAQKGKDLLLKLDDGTGTFVTVAGLRTRRLALNADAVDVTDAELVGRWRELLAGAGVRRASVSGTGIFKDQASDASIGRCSSTACCATGRSSFPISERSRARFKSRVSITGASMAPK